MEILRYMAAAIPWPYPDDGAISFVRFSLAAMERGERYAWAITERAGDDRPIGCIDLFPTNPDDNRGFGSVYRIRARAI